MSAEALSDLCAVAPNLKALELSIGVDPGAAKASLPPGLTRLAIGHAGEDSRPPRLARAAPGLRALTLWEAPMWSEGSVEAMVKGHGALEEVSFEGYNVSSCGYADLELYFRKQDLACLGRLPRLRRLSLVDGYLLAGAREEAPARLAGWARGWAGAPLEELRLLTSHDGDPHGVSRERFDRLRASRVFVGGLGGRDERLQGRARKVLARPAAWPRAAGRPPTPRSTALPAVLPHRPLLSPWPTPPHLAQPLAMCAEALGARLTRLCLYLEADGWGGAAARDPARALLPLPKFVKLEELELDYTGLGPIPRPTDPDDPYAAMFAPRAPAPPPTPAELLAPVEALLAPLPRLRPASLRRLRVALTVRVRGEADALGVAAGALNARYSPYLSLELRPY
jgi:hypothetical protein